MSNRLQAVRGMNDILPPDSGRWQGLEQVVARILNAYGYQEIRLPYVEVTELFARSIGEVTDIVEKEMYTFADRNGESLTLRPEGTAGCARACIEHGLLHNQTQRLWYQGPMFRYEKPQKGRYRQFHQVGVEAFGMDGPDIDVEIICMTARIWRELGIAGDVALELNSMGTLEARTLYRSRLVEYLERYRADLDQDSQRRLVTNPLRILDSKDERTRAIVADAPRLIDHLDEDSRAHFDELQERLTLAGVAFRVNPAIVRGLDYYARTVFEWVTGSLGAQGTVCGGGRYDGLVEQLGGRPTPAVGFAMGLERLVLMLGERGWNGPDQSPHAYLVAVGDAAERSGLALAERLRDHLPGLRLTANAGGGSFKSQLKRADRSAARFALILGEEEVARDQVTVKALREDRPQEFVPGTDLAGWLAARIGL